VRKLACLLLFFSTLLGVHAAEPTIRPGSVVVIPLKNEVTEAQFFYLRRVLKKAEAEHASAFIIDMDTYGGSLQAAVEMLGALMKSTVPTITYVNSNAGSAGALIALSTKRIYMAPVSAIGAAAPVTGEGKDLQETMNAKVISYFSGYFRSAAESNGYNPLLAEAFINKEKEVKIGDTIINPKGSLLTLSAQEAVKEYDGKPLLARAVVGNLDELCQKAGLDAKNIVRIEPTGFEYLSQWITALAPIFLMVGIICAYLEFKTPGFGVAGILSAICFLIFFTGHYIAGLTGFEVAAVFFLGVVLLLVELIFFPGFMIVAAIGLGLMFGSLLFAMVDLYPDRPINLSVDGLLWPMLNLAMAIAFSGILIALLARYFPSLPFFHRLILSETSLAGPSLPFEQPCGSPLPQIGETGTALSILRPAGKADFYGRLVDVVTDGEFIEPGTPIRIIHIAGERVVVAPV
jgi:membrane-bound serine protease (ClpP class)